MDNDEDEQGRLKAAPVHTSAETLSITADNPWREHAKGAALGPGEASTCLNMPRTNHNKYCEFVAIATGHL